MLLDIGGDLEEIAKDTARFISTDLPDIIAVEGLKHIKKSFKDEGFTDAFVEKWKKRKRNNKRGRIITRYRTNRIGKEGSLNKYGKKIKGRKILAGHNSSGNKLQNSFRARKKRNRVIFFSYKKYAERHNEGKDGMPRRTYIAASKVLDNNIEKKINRSLDNIFKN